MPEFNFGTLFAISKGVETCVKLVTKFSGLLCEERNTDVGTTLHSGSSIQKFYFKITALNCY